jgi:hypothetical protein
MRRRYEDGKLVPVQHRPGNPRVREIIRMVERTWFDGEAREATCAALRRMPAELWNQLLDALPRCVCGRPVAPTRAIRLHGQLGYCSEKCARTGAYRPPPKSTKRSKRASALALSEAMFQ